LGVGIGVYFAGDAYVCGAPVTSGVTRPRRATGRTLYIKIQAIASSIGWTKAGPFKLVKRAGQELARRLCRGSFTSTVIIRSIILENLLKA
jgi:hypothetical protein